MTDAPLRRIALELGLSPDAGELEIITSIRSRDSSLDLLARIVGGEHPVLSWDPAAERLTQTLEEPIKIGTVEIDKLVFRRAKAADLRAASKGNDGDSLGTVMVLAARLSGQHQSVVDELTPSDITTFGGEAVTFLSASLRRISAAAAGY